jgi:pimeloyl-ACP methyl ester carboxylesterase
MPHGPGFAPRPVPGSGTLRGMIWSRPGGAVDGPLLVLLHGLGATADAWRGVEALLPDAWKGGWLAVDMPGHGRSSWEPPYTFEAQGAAVDAILPDGRELVLLGHSMGAMTALVIAARRPTVSRVIGFSIKTYWPETHLAGLKRQALREPAVFARRDVAVGRYLKLAGLDGLISPDDPTVDSGVTQVDGGWQIAQDPASFDFGTPDMRALVDASPCRLVLARGSKDHLVRPENVSEYVDDPITLPGLGHSPHVEDPAQVVELLSR